MGGAGSARGGGSPGGAAHTSSSSGIEVQPVSSAMSALGPSPPVTRSTLYGTTDTDRRWRDTRPFVTMSEPKQAWEVWSDYRPPFAGELARVESGFDNDRQTHLLGHWSPEVDLLDWGLDREQQGVSGTERAAVPGA